ncbi:hypothetical protein [Paenarthrobacter sp. NPDC090522]|uniref:hypothetical protein n=1 Tax=Paenarthrobacter sp. NPDC090522 TaxID=3364383 RepID=UPI00380D581F
MTVSFYLPPLLLLAPVIGALLVYLFLRVQVWSSPDSKSVESHGLWVGIIGWMASSLQGAMSAGIIPANPGASNAPFTSEALLSALSWPIAAVLLVHALGQWSYPAPKAPRRYAELTVRRIRDFLPRKLAWTTLVIFAYAAAAVASIAALPAYAAVLPTPAAPSAEGTTVYMGQGQDGRIAGSELAGWLGGALAVLAAGTWLVLVLIARRRQLETLDSDDNRVLRTIATNRLLRTVSTIAAGLAAIAGNFAALPAPGAVWQSSWFTMLGFINMGVLLAMWWWRVPMLPSLVAGSNTVSGKALRADPGTHGAAKLSISIGALMGIMGAAPLLTIVFWYSFVPAQGEGTLGLAILVAAMASLVLLSIAVGELLLARNYGDPEAPLHWPRQAVSRGLLTFAIVSAAIFAIAIVMTGAGQGLVAASPSWPTNLLLTFGVGVVGIASILAVRRRRGVPESPGEQGLDAALRAISMYRIVRTLAAYFLAQSAMLLLTNVEAWGALYPAFDRLAPSPAPVVGAILLAASVAVVVTPVRRLFRGIPRRGSVTEPAP